MRLPIGRETQLDGLAVNPYGGEFYRRKKKGRLRGPEGFFSNQLLHEQHELLPERKPGTAKPLPALNSLANESSHSPVTTICLKKMMVTFHYTNPMPN